MEEIDQNIEQINQNIQTLNLILGCCGGHGACKGPGPRLYLVCDTFGAGPDQEFQIHQYWHYMITYARTYVYIYIDDI